MDLIPCHQCAMPGGCRQDGKCRRPQGLDHAMKEAIEAIAALKAATLRAETADAALQAAFLIHKSQQP